MQKIIVLVICSVLGGIIGGMGMGGGTLTIPLLTFFCSVTQHEAQALNLVAFIPMAAVTLIIHTKNKLVEYKKVLPIALPALAASIACSYAALQTDGKVLGVCYGIFLIVLGVSRLTSAALEFARGHSGVSCGFLCDETGIRGNNPADIPHNSRENISEGDAT